MVESEILTQMNRGQDSPTGYEEVNDQTNKINLCLDFDFYYLVY